MHAQPVRGVQVAADVLVQEYGRYFGMNTVALRGDASRGQAIPEPPCTASSRTSCSAPQPAGRTRCSATRGSRSATTSISADLIAAIDQVYRNPRQGEAYNMGGGRRSNCSMLEAIELCEKLAGRSLQWRYEETNRIGDHQWWISDTSRFELHYPDWTPTYDIEAILTDILGQAHDRW